MSWKLFLSLITTHFGKYHIMFCKPDQKLLIGQIIYLQCLILLSSRKNLQSFIHTHNGVNVEIMNKHDRYLWSCARSILITICFIWTHFLIRTRSSLICNNLWCENFIFWLSSFGDHGIYITLYIERTWRFCVTLSSLYYLYLVHERQHLPLQSNSIISMRPISHR